MTRFKYIGTLPMGDWQFCVVLIEGAEDVVVLIDKNGKHAPRFIQRDKLVEIEVG